ncbi:uncharacterized protein TNCV_2642731 [Trichonephila clavipes]|nr:uncharacterized protein TNCV_2642731 [Trichonephila clavipes]
MSDEQLDMDAGSFRSYYPYGLNVIWKGESVLLAFKQKSVDLLYIPNFDKSIDNSNNIRLARISSAKRRKRVTRGMSTLRNSMLELAVKFDDNYNTGLIKSFMFGMNKTEIKIMTDILIRYKFRDSHADAKRSIDRYKSSINGNQIWRNRIVECSFWKRKKPVSAEAIEKVELQVEEDKASNVQASTSVRLVAETLDLPRLTFQKIMRNILRYYPYNFNLCRNCFHMISRLDICSHCSFLLVWKLIQNGLGISSGQTKHTFIWMVQEFLTTVEFGNQTIRIPPYKLGYTHQK